MWQVVAVEVLQICPNGGKSVTLMYATCRCAEFFFFWGWGRGGVWLNYYSRYAFNLSKRKQINVQPNKFMLRLPFLPFFNNFWLGISFSFLSTFWFHLFWQAKPNDI